MIYCTKRADGLGGYTGISYPVEGRISEHLEGTTAEFIALEYSFIELGAPSYALCPSCQVSIPRQAMVGGIPCSRSQGASGKCSLGQSHRPLVDASGRS